MNGFLRFLQRRSKNQQLRCLKIEKDDGWRDGMMMEMEGGSLNRAILCLDDLAAQ